MSYVPRTEINLLILWGVLLTVPPQPSGADAPLRLSAWSLDSSPDVLLLPPPLFQLVLGSPGLSRGMSYGQASFQVALGVALGGFPVAPKRAAGSIFQDTANAPSSLDGGPCSAFPTLPSTVFQKSLTSPLAPCTRSCAS